MRTFGQALELLLKNLCGALSRIADNVHRVAQARLLGSRAKVN
jgi:hypothetical protein